MYIYLTPGSEPQCLRYSRATLEEAGRGHEKELCVYVCIYIYIDIDIDIDIDINRYIYMCVCICICIYI